MNLKDYEKKIEAVEDMSIDAVIQITVNRLNNSAFLAKDDFIDMLGVFWRPYLDWCVENKKISETMIEDDVYPNYVKNNEFALNSGLDTDSNYEMMILGLYLALVTQEFDIANEFIVDDRYNNYNEIV